MSSPLWNFFRGEENSNKVYKTSMQVKIKEQIYNKRCTNNEKIGLEALSVSYSSWHFPGRTNITLSTEESSDGASTSTRLIIK